MSDDSKEIQKQMVKSNDLYNVLSSFMKESSETERLKLYNKILDALEINHLLKYTGYSYDNSAAKSLIEIEDKYPPKKDTNENKLVNTLAGHIKSLEKRVEALQLAAKPQTGGKKTSRKVGSRKRITRKAGSRKKTSRK